MSFIQIIAFVLIFVGLKILISAMANKQYSYVGHAKLAKMKRWNKTDTDLWSVFPMPQLLRIASRL